MGALHSISCVKGMINGRHFDAPERLHFCSRFSSLRGRPEAGPNCGGGGGFVAPPAMQAAQCEMRMVDGIVMIMMMIRTVIIIVLI